MRDNPFAPLAEHCRRCPKCGPASREIFRLQDAVRARPDPRPQTADHLRVAELAGEMCEAGSGMYDAARRAMARAIVLA